MTSKGFSLVELSIVLVILGLLTGGILAGQSLIRASEMRAITTELQRYQSAAHTFRDKYFALPGDFRDATRVWQRAENVAHCVTNSGASPVASGSCDGTGNGEVEDAGAVSQHGEALHFWRQLALAGLIEGSYTGIAGPTAGGAGQDSIVGTNVPASKLGRAGWATRSTGTYAGDTYAFAGNYGNMISVGSQTPGWKPVGSILKPEEAWNIDTKMDDGRPATGKVLARGTMHATTGCTNGSSATDYAANYLLQYSSIACALYFLQAY